MKILRYMYNELFLFLLGGLLYANIEILARGYTHWSMIVVGGLCFVIIGILNELNVGKNLLFQYQCLIGGTIITILEFISGCIVNLLLHWDVWDYSSRPLNLLGQICFHNSILWILLSAVAIILDDVMRYMLFGEKIPKYYFKNKKNGGGD